MKAQTRLGCSSRTGAAFAPIMVTEIDWAPKSTMLAWGKSITGVVGGEGFGANFKYIADNSGNVSFFFLPMRLHELAAFKDILHLGNYTFSTILRFLSVGCVPLV